MTTLHDRWHQLLEPFGVRAETAHKTFTQLAAAYSEPGRFYHTLAHIESLLDTISVLKKQAKDLAALRLAAWFHDAVYDTRANDNEVRSAALAIQCLEEMNVPADIAAAVNRLILLTTNHQCKPEDCDGCLFLDADLAILGAEPADYQQYARQIRQEYAWVPEPDYRLGRTKVLSRFLQRPRIYYTEEMLSTREAKARLNLAEEIALLVT